MENDWVFMFNTMVDPLLEALSSFDSHENITFEGLLRFLHPLN